MATSFPTSLDALTNPTSADSLASPDHAGQHTDANDAIEAIEAQIGTTASPVLARLASPTFTGTPTLPTGTIATTQTAGNSTTAVATTAFVTTADNLKANLASPTFTGTPTLPTGTIATTQTSTDNSTKVATTAFVTTANNTVTSATRALIGSGSVSITPVANTMTSGSISWGTSLSASPNVATSANSSAATVTHTGHTGVGISGCTVWVLRSNTTVTTVDAVAIVP